jgi:hypothetical protein
MANYLRIAFSDETKTKLRVYPYPDTAGVNVTDTSLSLVGRGYPNYGTAFNENFLHLLENFASPSSPINPIEGQLWYDTSTTRKTLQIFNGSSWINVGGLYQQNTNPKFDGVELAKGDIWVDTNTAVMKVYNGSVWITVGQETGTGSRVEELDDAFTSTTHKTLLHFADGKVVSVISSDPTFTPNTYPADMQGFDKIKPGITLSSNYKLYGVAESADNLVVGSDVVPASSFLQKDSLLLQTITGTVLFETPNSPGQEGRDGVVVKGQDNPSTDYVQFYQVRPEAQNGGAAVVLNNAEDGKVIIQTRYNDEIKNSIIAQGGDVIIENLVCQTINASTGTLQLWAGPTTTIPTGWLVCDGSTATIATYPGLYNVLGSYYGNEDSIAFYLPNLSISRSKPTGGSTSTFYIIKT